MNFYLCGACNKRHPRLEFETNNSTSQVPNVGHGDIQGILVFKVTLCNSRVQEFRSRI